jgi:uncharacterized protein YndB with AHSA1/START domain
VPERAPDFVYTIYISAERERVWNGLIDEEVTKAYWGHSNVSDWKPGSRWEHVRSDGSGKIDIAGKVLEIDPPRRLVTSWSSPGDEDQPDKVSRVTYELTALGTETRLTVTHSELEAGSGMDAGIRRGWPAVLSSLKSLLERGAPLSKEIWS